jgi:hypothetical protein
MYNYDNEAYFLKKESTDVDRLRTNMSYDGGRARA